MKKAKMGLYDKAKTHIIDVAWTRSLHFMFFRMLRIVDRRIPLPKVVLKRVPSEEYLVKYMVPKHNGCFVDVGANVGLWTFLLAEKNITVHAFEPSPRPQRTLKQNAERYFNVHVYPFALGEGNYEAKLNLHEISGHNSLIGRGKDFTGNQISVVVRTLDSFNLQNVGLIKIDTEGYEVPILLGARQTIAKHKPRLVIEVHITYIENIEKITTILKQLNYSWMICWRLGYARHIVCDSIKF